MSQVGIATLIAYNRTSSCASSFCTGPRRLALAALFTTPTHCHARQFAPACEREFLKQSQARRIVAKNEAKKRINANGRSMPDGLCQQIGPEPALSKGFMNVQAYFCSLVIGRAPVEGRKTQPS